MSSTKGFPFHRARRITPKEVEEGRKAIESLTGKKRAKRRGRPPKATSEKYKPISIRLHPSALAWLKREASRRSMPYQSIINELILNKVA